MLVSWIASSFAAFLQLAPKKICLLKLTSLSGSNSWFQSVGHFVSLSLHLTLGVHGIHEVAVLIWVLLTVVSDSSSS